MTKLIRKALEAAGYTCEPTEENLIECYTEYANAYGQAMDDILDDISSGDITIEIMCKRLIRNR